MKVFSNKTVNANTCLVCMDTQVAKNMVNKIKTVRDHEKLRDINYLTDNIKIGK